MGDKTGIEWTQATWNPLVGCSITSPGCTNCYAMKMAARLERMGSARYAGLTQPSKAGPVWTGEVRLAPEETLLQPLRWKRPRTIFVNSMSDLFHESMPDDWVDRVFAVMASAPHHTFQVLTKRAERMHRYLSDLPGRQVAWACDSRLDFADLPLPNVWLGVSVEDQARADERIPHLLATPAAKRFLSCEPLLGSLHITAFLDGQEENGIASGRPVGTCIGWIPPLDWVIVGGESGPSARPMHPDWARSLRDQCVAADVPFFFKQWGSWSTVYDRDVDDPDWRRCPACDTDGGRYLNLAGGHGFHGERVVFVKRCAKAVAGATLDGREWKGMPASTRDNSFSHE